MVTGNRINKVTLGDSISNISFKGEFPFRWWLGESGKFYLCNVTDLLAAKDCSTFQVEWPARVSRQVSGRGGVCPFSVFATRILLFRAMF